MGKQVKTPRFYVDMPTFLHATGMTGWAGDEPRGGADLLYMNCANPFLRATGDDLPFKIGSHLQNPIKSAFPINFVALLNHNLASDINSYRVVGISQDFIDNDHDGFVWKNLTNNTNYNTNILNTERASNYDIKHEYNGTSIFTLNEPLNKHWNTFQIKYENGLDDTHTHQLGSLVVGKYFDCPNSPDLNLTMSRRFDGIKRQKTVGGKTLANIYYDGPTEWTMNGPDGTYKYPPFELDSIDPVLDELTMAIRAKSGLGRKGLRSWKLTFSYISEDDMWTSYENSSLSPFKEINIAVGDTHTVTGDSVVPSDDGETVADYFQPNPMLSDNSFNFVWNCTLGGTLPFIFQPDNTNNNPDQFSICTFRENTFNVDQVAPGTYTVQVTIDELA